MFDSDDEETMANQDQSFGSFTANDSDSDDQEMRDDFGDEVFDDEDEEDSKKVGKAFSDDNRSWLKPKSKKQQTQDDDEDLDDEEV